MQELERQLRLETRNHARLSNRYYNELVNVLMEDIETLGFMEKEEKESKKKELFRKNRRNPNELLQAIVADMNWGQRDIFCKWVYHKNLNCQEDVKKWREELSREDAKKLDLLLESQAMSRGTAYSLTECAHVLGIEVPESVAGQDNYSLYVEQIVGNRNAKEPNTNKNGMRDSVGPRKEREEADRKADYKIIHADQESSAALVMLEKTLRDQLCESRKIKEAMDVLQNKLQEKWEKKSQTLNEELGKKSASLLNKMHELQTTQDSTLQQLQDNIKKLANDVQQRLHTQDSNVNELMKKVGELAQGQKTVAQVCNANSDKIERSNNTQADALTQIAQDIQQSTQVISQKLENIETMNQTSLQLAPPMPQSTTAPINNDMERRIVKSLTRRFLFFVLVCCGIFFWQDIVQLWEKYLPLLNQWGADLQQWVEQYWK